MDSGLSDLKGQTILITGGTGMIGKWMVDYLLGNVDCRIIVTGRSKSKFHERFKNKGDLEFLEWDIAHKPLPKIEGTVGYIIHLASNTHPVAYATDPISTIVMNVSATKSLLDLALEKKCRRFVYASSVEVYGQNRGDIEKFTEGYCGYIDSNTLRAGYPESKRCGEALCQAYIKQFGLDVVIPRLARVYGPTLLNADTKALSQFLFCGAAGKDIVLKSDGRQRFSYLYVADAVSGLLKVMLRGVSGAAYNIAGDGEDLTLRELAELVARVCGVKVEMSVPSAVEQCGFSSATNARMDNSKLRALGWRAEFDLLRGVSQTIRALREKR